MIVENYHFQIINDYLILIKKFYQLLIGNKTDITEVLIDKIFYKIIESVKLLSYNPKIYNFELCYHKINKKIYPHYFSSFKEESNFDKNLYITDFVKAKVNNFYDRNIYIPHFETYYKSSTILYTDSEVVKHTSKFINITSSNLSQSLCYSDISNLNSELKDLGKFDINLIDKNTSRL